MHFLFIRILFLALCTLLLTPYAASIDFFGTTYSGIIFGIASSLAFGGVIIASEISLRRLTLHTFNTTMLGLLFGGLMAAAILFALQIGINDIFSPYKGLINLTVLLLSLYFGMIVTAKAAHDINISIPFIRFKPINEQKKDFILDSTAILDPRIVDLAAAGLFDNQLIIPRFILKECMEMVESTDENLRLKARRILEIIKKLENIEALHVRYGDADLSNSKDLQSKLTCLARTLDANILTADANRVQMTYLEGIRLINIHALSLALKPLAQTGEILLIKIQRYGKEPRQGIGYLEDGTMVVVNGGAKYIEETVQAQVLSVKQTPSGRMIFSNIMESEACHDSNFSMRSSECESSVAKSFFTV